MVLLLAFQALAWTRTADARPVFEAFAGYPWNVPTPLVIEQTGEPTLDHDARWSTKPFTLPLYYWIRAGWFDGSGEWRLELLHHKLYLQNTNDDIQDFEVTHGYNLVSVVRGFRFDRWVVSVGVGPVIAVPHSTVRNRTRPVSGGIFDSGYHFAGAGVRSGVGYRQPLGARFYLSLEGAVTAGWARVPVADGHADVPNVAFHGLFGVGWGL